MPETEPSADILWNIKNHIKDEHHLLKIIDDVLSTLRSETLEKRLSFLCDTREVHRKIFSSLTPEGYAAYAGTYRGEKGSILENRRAAVHFKNIDGINERDPALNPAEVIEYMDKLSNLITTTFNQSDQLSLDQYFSNMSRIFGMFSKIHPYLDGNGHISRLMMVILAEHKGIRVSPTWTIHPRPYGLEISIALQHFKNTPIILQQMLKIWFTI